jgi:hypothetical protein
MNNDPSVTPANQNTRPQTPAKPGETGITPNLGRERPGEGLDTGVDTGHVPPGQNRENRID